MDKTAEAAIWRPCHYCGKDKVVLRRNITASGYSQYFWWCLDCDSHARKQSIFIGHLVVQDWFKRGRLNGAKSLDDIPIINNYADDCRCVVCKKPGAEYNHWAPQSLAEYFGDDWAAWPGGYLCRFHHQLWHDIVTYYMPGRHDVELVARVRARWEGQGANHE